MPGRVPLEIGNAVTYPSSPGIGRVAELDGERVRIDFFESAAEPIAESRWRDLAEVRRTTLGLQTRVFFQDGHDRWRAGRVVGGGPDIYFVRLPNLRLDLDVAESRLRVRWEKSPRDPLQVLLSGANETPRFRDAREPVRRLLLAERAASASASGIVSSGVFIHAHQVSAALRISRDPVQRYLLADEVGMGKTIQAGLVMRQLLIDKPGRRIGLIVPDALVAQWRHELLDKFYLDDFPTAEGDLPFRIDLHSEPERWRELGDVDLLVIDEAHLLSRTSGPDDSPYRELASVTHAVPRVLMLSATPFARRADRHLALLHLLDPQLFRWEDRDTFAQLLATRHQLALAIFGLDEEPDPDNPELLDLQFEELRQLLPEDQALQSAMSSALDVMSPSNGDPSAIDMQRLRLAVAAVRTHVSETYRLHHRVIRNRRHVVEKQRLDQDGLLTPFELTGRTSPKVARLESEEAAAGADAVAEWAARCSSAILDNGLDSRLYGLALGVLISRLGGPVKDLQKVIDYRVTGTDTWALTADEKVLLDAAPALDFEASILERLESADDDGLDSLVATISRRVQATQRAIVFCGRGVLAADLSDALNRRSEFKNVYPHLTDQSDSQREARTVEWRTRRGVLVVDDSGDIGRNFQDADVVFHLRLPWNPNSLEQRIGRVDRYGRRRAAQQFIVADADRNGWLTTWIKVLASAFSIFRESISTLQEAVEDLLEELWSEALVGSIEGLQERERWIVEVLQRERRRINELDALEASFGAHGDGEVLAHAIGRYEEDCAGIEQSYTQLIRGHEGFRFVSKTNMDGSVTFQRGAEEDPLLSPRLLGRLETSREIRTGFFDRWRLKPGRRLFRRGNPFIDGIEELLALDDRGQAVAMWRLNRSWPHDPMIFFGFDFIIEADTAPMMEVLASRLDLEPVARRRADAALAPQHQRAWVAANTRDAVDDTDFSTYLSLPYLKGRDVNLNSERIGALHSLLGGEANLAPVAEGCFAEAREHVAVVADVKAASGKAVERVRRETEILLTQSRARAQATRLVLDPDALKVEVAMGRAIEAGVATPTVRVSSVSCVVVSAASWADYV